MVDHVTFDVTDLRRSKAFYEAALAPLGYSVIAEFEGKFVGFGVPPKPDFWIGAGKAPGTRIHFAIRAENRAAVDAFYRAALAAGGKDNGLPGLRPHYHASYYGAFVFDPDGYNVEAVCHDPKG
jgi:catechol 2,3-dioxygenase-like lactoylglutathione lyase family enzyme